jgi:hypothetical protein
MEEISREAAKNAKGWDLEVGLLIHFGAATFKEGIKRIVNNHTSFASSRLRVNQEGGRCAESI